MKINSNLIDLMTEKASHSPSSCKISAIAFDRKGDILGHTTNNCGNISIEKYKMMCEDGSSRSGMGLHAERRLMRRYGSIIKTILICRVGRSGNILPIDPCDKCKKVAEKLGIKIISIK